MADSKTIVDVFANDILCETLHVGGKLFPNDFQFGGSNQVAISYASNNGSGPLPFTNLLSLGMGVSIVGGNLSLGNAYSLVNIRVEEVVFGTHVDSFDLQILVDNNIVTAYTYLGSGDMNPRYGFKSLTINVGPNHVVSCQVVNATNILSVTVLATIYQVAP